MKVDLVDRETGEASILRFYDFDHGQLDSLTAVFIRLSESAVGESVVLAPSNSVATIGLRALTARVARPDAGAFVRDQAIEWSLSPDGWLDAADRAKVINPMELDTYQWLDTRGSLAVLLSPSGQW